MSSGATWKGVLLNHIMLLMVSNNKTINILSNTYILYVISKISTLDDTLYYLSPSVNCLDMKMLRFLIRIRGIMSDT